LCLTIEELPIFAGRGLCIGFGYGHNFFPWSGRSLYMDIGYNRMATVTQDFFFQGIWDSLLDCIMDRGHMLFRWLIFASTLFV
jgi:hypothetical protein